MTKKRGRPPRIQDVASKPKEPSFIDKVYAGEMPVGSLDHRSYVGPKDRYEEIGKHQVEVMKKLGLTPENKLLDVGCGSLRGGKHFIRLLDADNYCAIEPNMAILKKGLRIEVDESLAKEKRPKFDFNNKFDLDNFDCKFEFVIAQSIFSHACPEQVLKCLKEAEEILNKGGKIAFTYLKGSSDYTGKIWVYPNGCKYTENRMLEFVRKAGLFIEESNFKHPNGLTWMIATKQ